MLDPVVKGVGLRSRLGRLGDDALAQVLAWAPAPSLPALSATCHRFRAITNARSFLAYRLQAGCFEVAVAIDAAVRERMFSSDDEQGESEAYEESEDDDDLGYKGEYEYTRNFTASIRVDGSEVGSFQANLVDRLFSRAPSLFLSACDAESNDLWVMGKALFNEKGCPRYSELKRDPSLKDGGFLYIAKFTLQTKFRPKGMTDVALQAIRMLLALPEISHRWTVAACIAEGASEQDFIEDCWSFMRNNFKEIDEGSAHGKGWFFTTKALFSEDALTHEEAMRIPRRNDQVPNWTEPEGLDGELFHIIGRATESSGSDYGIVFADVDRLIEAGASLDGSFGLHCAACNGKPEVIKALVLRKADVNSFDAAGKTPLMVAATSSLSDAHTICLDVLLAFGADKSLTDYRGRSALGLYRAQTRSLEDHQQALLHIPRTGTSAAVEAKLWPPRGPTYADEAAK